MIVISSKRVIVDIIPAAFAEGLLLTDSLQAMLLFALFMSCIHYFFDQAFSVYSAAVEAATV